MQVVGQLTKVTWHKACRCLIPSIQRKRTFMPKAVLTISSKNYGA